MRNLSKIISASILSLVASSASAQEAPAQAAPPTATVYLDLGLGGVDTSVGPIDASLVGFSPVLGGSYQVTPWLKLDAALLFSLGTVSVGDNSETSFRMGNPYLDARYTYANGGLSLEAGLGLAFPVASLDTDSPAELAASSGALSSGLWMRGATSPWSFSADTLTVLVPFNVTYKIDGAPVMLRGGAALGGLIGVRDNDGSNFYGQFDVGAGYLFSDFEAGLRFLFLGVEGPGDNFFVSTSPYFRANFGNYFAQAAIHVNLTETHGDGNRFISGQLIGGINIQ